ncbi:MAG: Diaminobutyrate--2-oxoglutarate transaminase [Deltaproteobacteria bacterium ADurb.Bin151]|jgi:diaminobutyrate-2-oxoglutarate transaminase|nr:diaminobutyrate--2-oxoglutarate transaminase [Smithella sp.]OQB56064.1 MAG: Diaminobutyrate--2-oxoglutarate transaminase [Deltaproteobacteria bacterium ADurb.Bin151]HPJ97655.1 diaminobutyrate--2-oxoglutarate transaminase [Syntrophales bacterium]HRY35378.1 diaminobutyrate--2-oxoglutarate transaminase [Smithellaceae bacterium]
METIRRLESEVRSYSRSFPVVFEKAKDAFLFDESGNRYIDFFAGAGTLNYGHNNDRMKKKLIEYLENDGIVHGLDMATVAKEDLLLKMESVLFKPRNLDYKVQFTGPTGTNAVEAGLKLARMLKKRSNVISFTNGYHGLTMGSMSVTANAYYRDEAFINRSDVSFLPYDGYLGKDINTAQYMRRFLEDNSSGVDIPSAVILETVQGEGGIRVASDEWLREVEAICREFDILLIVDDIQVGNGRTGNFFSFEQSGIKPDIVTVSKSFSGYGLPMSLVLFRRELDIWKAGQHTGTFRGNNLAFVSASVALEYWKDDRFSKDIFRKGAILSGRLHTISGKYPQLNAEVRGRGFIYGMAVEPSELAREISMACFKNKLIIELAGARNNVIKFLAPLIIPDEVLMEGLDILDASIGSVLKNR